MDKAVKKRRVKTIKVGPLGLRAIDDIKPKASKLIEGSLGFNKKITDKDAIEILGYKYIKKNFGKVHANELINILNIETDRKKKLLKSNRVW